MLLFGTSCQPGQPGNSLFEDKCNLGAAAPNSCKPDAEGKASADYNGFESNLKQGQY